MRQALKLVCDNPHVVPRFRPNGEALHQLADRLTDEIRSGRVDGARLAVTLAHLSPIGIAIVATWMSRAGLAEAEILQVIA